jgi:ADP-heptose:LPS heptosyltransferase
MIFQYLKNRYEVRRLAALIYLGLADCFWWALEKLCRLKTPLLSLNLENITAPKKILLVNGAHLGDLVISTAVIRRIKEVNPQIEIGFVAGSWGSELLRSHPGVDHFYPINHWRLNRSTASTLSKVLLYWKQWWAALRAIRKDKYDIAILLNSFYPNFASLLWLSRCKLTVGYVSAGGGALLSLRLPKPKHSEQAIQLALLDAINIHGVSSGWIQVNDSLLSKAAKDDLPQKFILLHPGTGNLAKEWPVERWINLGKMLRNEAYAIVLTGNGSAEATLCKRIATEVNSLDLSNRINLNDWFFVIQKASLVIGVDSAAGHIASALQKPFIGIYSGIGEVSRWTPAGKAISILTHSMSCSPCHTRPCKDRPCLLKIEPIDVLAATNPFLTK